MPASVRYWVGKTDLVLLVVIEELIDRHLEEHRAGQAGGGDAERHVDVLRHAPPFGTETAHLVIGRMSSTWFMSCSEPMSANGARALPADDDHRDVGAVRARHAGHGVGEAGSRGDDRHAGPTGDARPAVGRVRRGLLVAHVDDADALVEAAVVDRHHVPAAEGEDEGDVLGAQRARHQRPPWMYPIPERPSLRFDRARSRPRRTIATGSQSGNGRRR